MASKKAVTAVLGSWVFALAWAAAGGADAAGLDAAPSVVFEYDPPPHPAIIPAASTATKMQSVSWWANPFLE